MLPASDQGSDANGKSLSLAHQAITPRQNSCYDVCAVHWLAEMQVHKVHINLESHSVCPLVRYGTPQPPLSPWRVCPPQNQRGGAGGHTGLRVRGWGSPSSEDCRKSLALCLLCEQVPAVGLMGSSWTKSGGQVSYPTVSKTRKRTMVHILPKMIRGQPQGSIREKRF